MLFLAVNPPVSQLVNDLSFCGTFQQGDRDLQDDFATGEQTELAYALYEQHADFVFHTCVLLNTNWVFYF